MLKAELKSRINQLWDSFWSGGIANPLTAIEQMSYLIFMKRLEDEDVAREQNAQLSGKEYKTMNIEIRILLTKYYTQEIEKLSGLLGENYSWDILRKQ